MKHFVGAILFFYFVPVWGQDASLVHSARRFPGESYQHAVRRNLGNAREFLNTSAQGEAVPLTDLNLKNATAVLSPADAATIFQKGRDFRFLNDPDVSGFPRRPSWLYPDDGCWARAALFSQNMKSWNYPRAFKVFVFGSLDVKTKNSPAGEVLWWYHVAPAALVNSQVTIFDPAIEPKNPLPLRDWILTMVPTLDQVKVSLCSPSTYMPSSLCDTPEVQEEGAAVADQTYYLSLERQRLIYLRRDPVKELGDSPTWLSKAQ